VRFRVALGGACEGVRTAEGEHPKTRSIGTIPIMWAPAPVMYPTGPVEKPGCRGRLAG
jgi:hypothetical protein